MDEEEQTQETKTLRSQETSSGAFVSNCSLVKVSTPDLHLRRSPKPGLGRPDTLPLRDAVVSFVSFSRCDNSREALFSYFCLALKKVLSEAAICLATESL